MSKKERLIRALAVKYGLDPDAVVAIANVEGQDALHGGRSVGDNGTSFGPFQLHEGGALPKGRGSAWAHSRAGIDYAEREMSKVARGLTGRAAVSAISSKFERPADIPGEITKAMGYYRHTGSAGGPADGGGVSARGGAPTPSFHAQGGVDRKQVAMALLQTVGQANPDYSQVLELLRQEHTQTSPSPSMGAAPSTPAARPHRGGINELFYDPLGGIKHGQQTGAIGHHQDHVHVALDNLQAQLAAERHARRQGLHVGEEQDSDFHNVHATHSYHNTDFPGTHYREAADVSGDPGSMAAYYRWVARTYKGQK